MRFCCNKSYDDNVNKAGRKLHGAAGNRRLEMMILRTFVEDGPLVVQLGGFRSGALLAGAQRAEILRGSRHDILEQFYDDSSHWKATESWAGVYTGEDQA